MKNLIVIFVFSMLCKPIIPLAAYVVNYDYITKVLCENKSKPKLQCNGKCHLMKELAKASNEDKPVSSDKKNSFKEVELLFCQSINTNVGGACNVDFSKNKNTFYSNNYLYLNADAPFHPPII